MRSSEIGRLKKVHPHAWLWEPMEGDPGFVLNSMFGAKTAYLDGRIYLGFISRGEEPWRGVLVATDRDRHAMLTVEFGSLHPHPVLPKWLYLPEAADDFEKVATQLVKLALRRDSRFGVTPKPRKARKRRRSAK
jgi:hypothetical protein